MSCYVKVFETGREVGELRLDAGGLSGTAYDQNDRVIIDAALEPYSELIDGTPHNFDASADPVSFLFNLGKHLRSGLGISVSHVQDTEEPDEVDDENDIA